MRGGCPAGGQCLAGGWHLAGGGGGQRLAGGGGDRQHAARVTAVDDGRRLAVSDVTALVMTQRPVATWVAKASTLGSDGGP